MRRLCLLAFLLLPGVVAAQTITPGITSGAGTLAAPVLLTDSSNYTVPSGVFQLRGAMGAAGGGGGGAGAAAATGAAGLPGMMFTFVMVVTPGQVIAYTNGSGGTRGSSAGGNGGAGGDTTFGTLTAKGGQLGLGAATGNAAGGVSAANGTAGTVPQAMITGSAAVPTASTFIVSQSASSSFTGTAGSAGTGGQAKGIWGSSTPGTNGNATDCVGYNTGGSGAGSTINTAGTGALGCPGAILLW